MQQMKMQFGMLVPKVKFGAVELKRRFMRSKQKIYFSQISAEKFQKFCLS